MESMLRRIFQSESSAGNFNERGVGFSARMESSRGNFKDGVVFCLDGTFHLGASCKTMKFFMKGEPDNIY